MKSFGLVAIMVKLGTPIPIEDNSRSLKLNGNARVDFFREILVEVGDHQSLMEGESTYMAQLNSLSKLLHHVDPSSKTGDDPNVQSSLILIDELGGGTDPTAGACIAQAILEKILENERIRTIVTTHSTQLKALSTDERFQSASVLLQASDSKDSRFRLPTYKLCYGAIGNSYALGAASRANPPISEDVLDRAANLIASSQDRNGEYLRILTEAMEQDRETLAIATQVTNEYIADIVKCRDAIIALSRSYDQHLSRIEGRLNDMYNELKHDETRNAYDLLGESLSTLRLARKLNKSKEEMLKDKGMRVVSMSDNLQSGDRVIVIAKGAFEGESAFVSYDQNDVAFDELSVDLECELGFHLEEPAQQLQSFKMKRSDLALWDYPNFDEDWGVPVLDLQQTQSIPDSRNSLINVLQKLKTAGPEKKKSTGSTNIIANGGSKYKSSRQRKAAKKKKRK